MTAAPRPSAADAAHAAEAFGLQGAALQRLDTGHINESFRAAAGAEQLLLQWLNPVVFPNPEAVAANVERVAAHLASVDAETPWPRLHQTPDGHRHLRLASGLWRAWQWFDGAITLQRPEGPERATAGAEACGRLLRALDSLAPEALQPVMQGFHDPAVRLAALDAARSGASATALGAAQAELDAIEALRAELTQPSPAGRLRVIHGDTKFTNVLFLPDAVTVVDFDTVMAGTLALDFGDLLRGAAAAGAEDDPQQAVLAADMLEPLCAGFLRGAGDLFTDEELPAMASAPARLARILAVRFVTDHLQGNRYFRVADASHNLRRARTQLRLGDAFAAQVAPLTELLERDR